MTLAEKVFAIRNFYHLTQTTLAKQIGCVQSEVHYIEGGYIPDNDTLVAINELYKGVEMA